LSNLISRLTICISFSSFPDHEEAIGRLASEMGFENVSLSSQVIPMIKAVPRGFTSKHGIFSIRINKLNQRRSLKSRIMLIKPIYKNLP
jgi:hypothetical protein